MAPVENNPQELLEQQLKDTIQDLYQIMLQITMYTTTPTHSSHTALTSSLQTLSASLQAVHTTAVAGAPPTPDGVPPNAQDQLGMPPGVPLHDPARHVTPGALPNIPPELVQYVENGRNPDIYTREFVELVRRGNQLMRGKMGAFAQLRDVLAGEMRSAMPEVAEDVARVVEMTSPVKREGA